MKAVTALVTVAGLALQVMPLRGQAPAPSRPGQELVDAPSARGLILSDQARRFLVLQSSAFHTEFMGCMIGTVRELTIIVERIAPADVEPSRSTQTSVVPWQTCEDAGWTGTVGMIHSHPTGERCWYVFPGTQVPTSDGQSFLTTSYPLDAIVCGSRVVWVSRDLSQREIPLLGDQVAKLASTTAP